MYKLSQLACSGFMGAGGCHACLHWFASPSPLVPSGAIAVQAGGLYHTEEQPAWDTHHPHSEQKPACPCLGGDVTSSLQVAGERAIRALHS